MQLLPGTTLQVGSHAVTVEKFLSEGGFAQIYSAKIDPPEHGKEIACLKRVIMPDKKGLDQLRNEVEVMQKLSNCDNIVCYFDSHAARLENNSFEVFVLMELCSKNSLLDYMNARLKIKLTELEILSIMFDISRAVYTMHEMKLIHRDIKIENVLLDENDVFKLCDFGSTCPVLKVPQTQEELALLQNDLLHQTTPQYRSPEMIDLSRGFPIDEKSDMWALGVFLYKLCYYRTPFEDDGEMAILHSAYQIPPLPEYSPHLGDLIRALLANDPHLRPNIVQLVWMVGDLLEIPRENINVVDLYARGEYTPNSWKVAQFVPCEDASLSQMQDVTLTSAQYQQFCFVEYRKSVALQQKNQQVMAYNYQLQMLYQGACAPAPAPAPAAPVMVDAAGNVPPCTPPAHPNSNPVQLPLLEPHLQAPPAPPSEETQPVALHLSGKVPSSSSLPSLAGTGESHNPWKKEGHVGNPWQDQLEPQDALIELEDPSVKERENSQPLESKE